MAPTGLAVDQSFRVFVADMGNRRVRLIDQGQVTTLAGSGPSGTGAGGFADGPAGSALFNGLVGVAVDGAGKVYVADYGNNRIRVVFGGQVTTLAGNGARDFADGPAAAAMFSWPRGVAVDSSGRVYVGDSTNHRIRVVFNGQVSTLAGDGVQGFADGPAATARFDTPWGVAVGRADELYVADNGNNRVRVVSNGQVTTLAGDGGWGFSDGPGELAKLARPRGVAVDSSGKVYVADSDNNRIRVFSP